MTNQPDPRRGQALLLVTFALIAMCGLLGLAVDLGWGYFVKKSAQASADAAALSAAYYGIGQVGQTQNFPATKYSSGGNACPSGNVNTNGCAYAQNQGFAGSASTLSGVTFPPPTVSNLATGSFWVTARAVQVIPQLFSAVLGNPTGISSARATAAVVTEYINGALHTLNRQYDLIAASGLPQGADIGGSGQIGVPSGLVMSSQAPSAGSGVSVAGPITIVSPGNASGLGASPITDIGDSGTFLDPYRDLPQPILPSQTVLPNSTYSLLSTYGVMGGNLVNGNVFLVVGTAIQAVVPPPYPSGNYVPITCSPAPCAPSGTANLDTVDQITLAQSATFSDSTPTCYPGTGSTFGCFFFYGGLRVSPGATMTMGAGEFVMVGGGSSGMDFVAPSGAYLDSQVSCPNPSNCPTAGVILIMTGTSSSPITLGSTGYNNANLDLYPGLGYQIGSSPILVHAATTTPMLNFGSVSLLAGADNAGAAVTGLVAKNLPSSLVTNLSNTLVPFDGVVLWQDQANSTIEYTPNSSVLLPGYINTATCSGTLDNPCTKALPVFGSEGMTLQAPANTGIEGIVYQPRGAFLQTGGGTIQGSIQIITGAISMQGGGTINITLPPTSAKRRVVALVE